MKEDFLHYVWKHQLFDRSGLSTSSGLPVRVEHPGEINEDSGPDFFMAKIWIGAIKWNGPVEIHIDGKDWFRHNHHVDENYDLIILHVVYENPVELSRNDNTKIPTLVLRGRISEGTKLKYHGFEPLERVLCKNQLRRLKKETVSATVIEAANKRLKRRASLLVSALPGVDYDWSELTYRTLGTNFGFKINAAGFKALVETVPYRILSRYLSESEDLESLLLGAAGFLGLSKDSYDLELQERFSFLSAKHEIGRVPLHHMHWNTVKVRPGGFPTLRIAQFVFLLAKLPDLFSEVIGSTSLEETKMKLAVDNLRYWKNHYHFGRTIESKRIQFGDGSIENLIINTVVPIQAAWALYTGSDPSSYQTLLQQLPSERNRIIRQWQTLSISSDNAIESQGLIELFNSGCSKRKCLDCGIGQQVLNL